MDTAAIIIWSIIVGYGHICDYQVRHQKIEAALYAACGEGNDSACTKWEEIQDKREDRRKRDEISNTIKYYR